MKSFHFKWTTPTAYIPEYKETESLSITQIAAEFSAVVTSESEDEAKLQLARVFNTTNNLTSKEISK